MRILLVPSHWLFVLLAAALPAPAWGQASADLIYSVKGGAPRRANIVSMTAVEVKAEMAGIEQSFPVNEIKQIRFADEPQPLANARNAVEQRNYNTALSELEKINAADLKRDFERHEVAYLRAYCLARMAMTEGGNKSDAEKALLDFVRATNRNNYHFFDAAELLGDLAVAAGKFDEAARYYGEQGLGGAPWPEHKLRANLALGRALASSGKPDEALASFEAVIASELSTPQANVIKQYALIGKASALAEKGNPDEGITILKDIIAKGDPSDSRLFARANNALGNCYLKANRSKDALLAFLQTDILFFSDAESHAEALYRLSKLWDSLNKPDRASEARNTLRQRYAGSYWVSLP
jgi:tetratricopeptide (TPR) repeat protein